MMQVNLVVPELGGLVWCAVILNLTKSDVGAESVGRQTALSDWRRLNVALTRAKERVYIVASSDLASGRSLNRLLELYKWSRDDLESHIEINREDYETRIARIEQLKVS